MYLKYWLWNICSIYPSICSLVSFITCFSYSVGNFIAGLKFFLLGMLTICGWTSVLFSVGLWLLCYASQPFYAYDLVFIWIYECIPSCHQTSQPKNLKNPKNPVLLYWDYWDYVGLFSCSMGTIFGTNIFGAVVREWILKHIFPWDTYHFTGFKRWT